VSLSLRCAAVKRALLLLALAAAGLPGCSLGSDSAEPGDDDADKRGAAIACLTEQKHLEASEHGDNQILVGDATSGPRIVFYLTSGQAEAAQFEGDGEGAEQIGSALLFVRKGSDDVLEDVEACLQSL
jgi:hypothetical protein